MSAIHVPQFTLTSLGNDEKINVDRVKIGLCPTDLIFTPNELELTSFARTVKTTISWMQVESN